MNSAETGLVKIASCVPIMVVSDLLDWSDSYVSDQTVLLLNEIKLT